MRLLLIDNFGGDGMLDYAMRATADGHDVKWFFHRTERTKDYGKGLATVVDDWRQWMRWADLVVLADNTKYLREVDAWRKNHGVKVVGATQEAAAWELDRTLGQKVFKKAGISVPPYREFSDYDAAIAYVKREGRRFVSKPCGDEPDKSLSYCAKSPEDLVYMLMRWKKANKLKGAFILQEFVPGVEMAVGGWFGPHGFNEGWCENWEEKNLMAGGTGPATGEMGTILRYVKKSKLADKVLKPLETALDDIGYVGYIDVNCIIDDNGDPWPLEFTCYDDETEVFTASGWKLFRDLSVGEMVATLNPQTDEMTFAPATAKIEKAHHGEMVRFVGENGGLDLRVTPDHQMWVAPRGGNYKFKRADKVGVGELNLVRRGYSWAGLDTPTFTLPAYTERHWLGRHKKEHLIDHPAIEMPMEIWLSFLGLYISEGSLGKGGYIVNITQAPKNMPKIAPLLRRFPIKQGKCSRGVQFSSIQLGSYIRSLGLGLAHQKFVPPQFKTLAPKYLSALLDGLVAGDGSVHKRTGQRTYATCSRRLADDVQELMTKIGGVGRIVAGARAGTTMTIGTKTYTRNHDQYNVSERKQKIDAWIDKRTTRRERYDGMVYCCEVNPFHLLYVRRGGIPVWSGNCRMGWPTFNIQQCLHKGDCVQWLADLSDGRDSRPLLLNKLACGVVMAIPPFPYSQEVKKEVCGIPIYGLTAGMMEHVHPCEMMMGEAPQDVNGKVVILPSMVTAGAYVLVVTGVGDTVRRARSQTYRRLEKLKAPASPFWRPDIGIRLKKQLPLLQAKGFASSPMMEF